MGLLIDTSVIIRIEREDRSIEDLIASLGGEDAGIAAITASELLVGVLKAAPETRRRTREAFVETVLQSFPVRPIDLSVARTHARLLTALQATGTMIGLHDLLIAATAVANGYGVLTYNIREFAQVPDLEIHTWSP